MVILLLVLALAILCTAAWFAILLDPALRDELLCGPDVED